MRRRTPVMVVGIDGLPGGFAAARWAAIEAEACGVPLELVYAVDPAHRTRAVVDDPARVHRIAMAALRTAESQARSVASNLVVIRKVVRGSAASALAQSNAVATCAGTNGIRTAQLGHRISTATEVMLAARGAVVVVRGDPLRGGVVVVRMDITTLSLAIYFTENRSCIALFVAPRLDVHDVGTVLHPSVELGWRTLDCSVMVAAPPERRLGLRP